ncbi:hypothetical protein ALC62_13966 [Cyphomyrmex costatus]|uniref:Gustatory receptor n=1 Tax=Cyphomyrmex costatus TaxID=456900 RepID=A0A195C5S8_9HYME|nr:hypothetical protein ALC62_13966 [Cyphomyrmex costatus]
MTITLQSALAPLFITSSFFCLGLFEYPLGQPRLYFSCLYTTGALSIWSSLVYYCCNLDIYQLNIRMSSETIISFILIFIFLSLIFISFYRYKELKICLHELSIVDDTLEALGMPKEYETLQSWMIRIIFVWIIYFFFEITMSYYLFCNVVSYCFEILFPFTIFTLFYSYLKYVSISSALVCGTLLGYTSLRFHRVNDRLHVLYSNLFENNADYGCKRQNRFILVRQRIIRAKDCKQHIWILM